MSKKVQSTFPFAASAAAAAADADSTAASALVSPPLLPSSARWKDDIDLVNERKKPLDSRLHLHLAQLQHEK